MIQHNFSGPSAELEMQRRIHAQTKIFTREKRGLSWFHVIVVFSCLGCAYALLFRQPHFLICVSLSLLISLLLVRVFVIYHDYVHKSILQKSGLAKLIFAFVGLYMLAPMPVWNRTHNHHHQHNSKLNGSGIGSFPLLTKSAFVALSPRERFVYLAIRHPAAIMLAYLFTFMYGMCIQNLVWNFRKRDGSLTSLAVHFAAAFGFYAAGGLPLFAFGFLLPAMVSSCLGSYLFYVQHNFPGVVHHPDKNWSHFKAAMASSAYIRMNPVMEWFTGNIGYHHIHHLNAAIPFYNLPRIYHAVVEFRIPPNTSLHPLDIIRCLRLKVWDSSTEKMVGIRD